MVVRQAVVVELGAQVLGDLRGLFGDGRQSMAVFFFHEGCLRDPFGV